MPSRIYRNGVPYGGGGSASDSSVQAVRCGDDIYTPVEGTVNLPDFTTINDTTASDSSVYSSNKTNVLLGAKADKTETAEYPIASTTTSINPTITDSADGLIQEVKVYGESRTSKNLFDKTAVTANSALNPADGTTDTINYWSVSDYVKVSAGSYVYSINTTATLGNNIVFCYYNASKEFVSSETILYQNTPIAVVVPANVTYARFEVNNKYIDKVQFELGSTPTPYEPYFSGIHGIGEDGELNVKTCGKNLLNPATIGLYQATSDPTVIRAGFAPIYVHAGTYTLSYNRRTTDIALWITDISDYSYQQVLPNGQYIVPSDTYIMVRSGLDDIAAFNYYFSNIQIKLGSTATAYEPYVSTSATVTTGLPYCGIPVTTGETYTDEQGQKWLADTASVEGVTTRCGVIEDLSQLNWTFRDDWQVFTVLISNTKKFGNGLVSSEYLTFQTNTPLIENGIMFNAANRLICSIAEYKDPVDINGFKAAIAGIKLIYELAEPTTTPLTTAEKSALLNLKTFDSTTNVTITDDPTVDVGYLLNTDNGQAVAELENRIKSEIDEVKNENERSHFCYSYKIDMSDSNPATCVKPHFDPRYGCDNFNFTSAHMDYANDRFDYGSWEGFIRRIARPCMLKYDGTVDYYLDPDDYSKKITGEASDVADVNYQGNAMVELEKLYFKRYTYNGIQYCFITDRKLDKSFKCYAHHDKYGRELDYIYRACYDGMYDGTRLRSISGVDYHNRNALTAGYIMSNATRQEEMDFAKANNVSTERGEGWNILHKSEWDYINDILVLIGMSTDTQTTFGRGRDSGYVSIENTGIISTGTMDTKGLFWGENNGGAGVKVLGIENPWANIWKSCAGWMLISNQHYTKMTFGTEDGSTGTGFNTDGTGYLATGVSISADGYISDWAENDNGFLPTAASGSASTYRCDHVWQNTATYFALVGGDSGGGLQCGAFCTHLDDGAGFRYWVVGAVLSYKPLAGGELAA